jgi:transcriptional regulator with XRE-family HTH domain
MAKSSITKLPDRGPGSEFARRLGERIRARRHSLGLTQTQLGAPLTKGFVSEVERGRSLPSLSALFLIAERLHLPTGELLDDVNNHLSLVYAGPDEHSNRRQERDSK